MRTKVLFRVNNSLCQHLKCRQQSVLQELCNNTLNFIRSTSFVQFSSCDLLAPISLSFIADAAVARHVLDIVFTAPPPFSLAVTC